MPSVSEGLGTPAAAEGVNSEAGFEAAMAEKVGRTEELEAREPRLSTAIAEGLTSGDDEEEPVEEEEEVVEDEEELSAEEDSTPPELQALLEKHGGDPIKALAEVEERRRNAESKIGEQGNRLGDLRRELDELRGELRAVGQRASQPVTAEPLSDEAVYDMIENQGGLQAALWAVNNRPSEYDRILEVWATEEPIQAQRFDLNYQLALRQQQESTPTTDPWVEQQKQTAYIEQTLSAVASESDDWTTIEPHMLTALEQVPKRITALALSEDPEERLDAARVIADRARLIAGTQVKTAAKARQNEVAAERKRSATVASGSLRPVAPPRAEAGEMSSEDIKKEFHKQLLATETTSVHEGLTFGK